MVRCQSKDGAVSIVFNNCFSVSINVFIRQLMLVCIALLCSLTVAHAQSFRLSGVDFNKSEYLDAKQLQSVVAPYMNRPIVFSDVNKMIKNVENLYQAKGIVTASVVIQPQEVVNGGVLKLTLIEATTEVAVYKARSEFQKNLLQINFPEEIGEHPDYDDITKRLRFFQVAYGVLPSIDFAPGRAPGTATKAVNLTVEKQSSWVAALDNYANDGEDRTRFTITRNYFDLTGKLDSLTASASATAGGFRLNASYALPVGAYGGRLFFGGSYSDTMVVAGPFAVTAAESQSTELNSFYSQPFKVTSDGYYQFQVGVNLVNTGSAVSGRDFQDVKLMELEGRVSTVKSFAKSAVSADVGIKIGQSKSGVAASNDGTFALLSANAAYTRSLNDAFSLGISGRMQVAPGQSLPSSRRFSGGGLSNLVGYPDDVRTGENGITTRLQINCDAPCFKGDIATYRPELHAFADVGYIDTFRGGATELGENSTLSSIGVGGNFSVKNTVVTMQVGIPLNETTGFTDVNKPRFYAGVNYRF